MTSGELRNEGRRTRLAAAPKIFNHGIHGTHGKQKSVCCSNQVQLLASVSVSFRVFRGECPSSEGRRTRPAAEPKIFNHGIHGTHGKQKSVCCSNQLQLLASVSVSFRVFRGKFPSSAVRLGERMGGREVGKR